MQLQGGDSGDTPAIETQWQTEVIRQAVADTRETSTLSNKFRDHSKLVSTLNAMIGNPGATTQGLIEKFTRKSSQIGAPQAKWAKGPKNQTGRRGNGGPTYMHEQNNYSIGIRTY
jgi:hypothetical protein